MKVTFFNRARRFATVYGLAAALGMMSVSCASDGDGDEFEEEFEEGEELEGDEEFSDENEEFTNDENLNAENLDGEDLNAEGFNNEEGENNFGLQNEGGGEFNNEFGNQDFGGEENPGLADGNFGNQNFGNENFGEQGFDNQEAAGEGNLAVDNGFGEGFDNGFGNNFGEQGDFGNESVPTEDVVTESVPVDDGAQGFGDDGLATDAPPPAAGGTVYYVSMTGTELKQSPDATAAVVSTLEQGDSLLVSSQDGQWAQVGNRGWVSMTALSMQAVPRAKTSNPWR